MEISKKLAILGIISIFSLRIHLTESSTQIACSDDESFKCDDQGHQCVSSSSKCDGVPDCGNGRDESVPVCGCLSNEFQCNTTHCVSLTKRCDLELDCEDGSDEDGCETFECAGSHFKCGNHKCVPRDVTCDFVDNCGDNSDEKLCPEVPCIFGFFTCDNRECVMVERLCDGVRNCKDGSDELQERCDAQYRCPSGFYVSMSSICDGIPDCKFTHMDEAACGDCTDGRFRCSNGECVPPCDSLCDCIDCGDEMACGTSICDPSTHYTCPGFYRCIAHSKLCDGVDDCMNSRYGTDEYYCHNSTDCSSYTRETAEYACKENRCFPNGAKCNMFSECAGGEDEEGCDFKECPPGSRQCRHGNCVNESYWCDGQNQCRDWSDETDCENHKCPDGYVKCKGGQCIPEYKWCNHWPNCPDKSDETDCEYRDCGAGEFTCHNRECIPASMVCYKGEKFERDGCEDESHLINCTTHECGPGEFKCLHSFCIDEEKCCDGSPDCPNIYDEYNNFCADRQVTCPYRSKECQCYHYSMNCDNLGLHHLPIPLKQERISEFDYSGNQLAKALTPSSFNDSVMDAMNSLDLSNNSLVALPARMFLFLWRLSYLNLANNSLTAIQNTTLVGLLNLKQLFLQGNRLQTIAPNSFLDLGQLTTLDLSNQNLTTLEPNTFLGLKSLRMLNLSGNRLEFLRNGVFNGLDHLLTLDLTNNQLELIEKSVFNSAPELSLLLTDEFRFCCMARWVDRCLPEGDEFSSCEDLMSNIVLRISIWVLGLMASLGNLLVIFWRARTVRGSKVHSFLITNLALGDLLMGIYLLIIASVDAHYRGIYILHDFTWRHSGLCHCAGFFSMFSSELSVLTLTVITLDRLCCIIFPLKIRRLGVKGAYVLMTGIWACVLVLSGIPLAGIHYFGNFYGRSGVCLALPVTPARPSGWEYSIIVFMVVNSLSFLVIAISYVWMFMVAKETRSAVRSPEAKTDKAMAKRMTLIVMTDFVCWVPIIAMGLVSLAGAHASNQVYAWIAVFILPINSAINPVLYTLSTAPFVGNVQNRARRFRKSFMNSMTVDTKASFVDDRTVNSYTDRKSSPHQGETIRMKNLRVNVPGYSGRNSSDM